MENEVLKQFQISVRKELYDNIIPFWANRTIDPNGGFIGAMKNDGTIVKNAVKGLILNTRILWTFSSLHVFDKKQEHKVIAQRAFDYFIKYFWDEQYGGAFWQLDSNGKVVNDTKRIYGQGFAIYALSEYYRAFGNEEALEKAKIIFNKMEQYAHDNEYGGYLETFNRDWQLAKVQNLSGGDVAAPKSMNSHLHIMEAFANLYDVWKDPLLEKRLEELIYIFTDCILQPDRFYCQLYFDNQWHPKSDTMSFGHDIETSWLMYRDTEILNKPELLKKVRTISVRLAEVIYLYGMDNKQSLLNEANSKGVTNSEKHWWIQAEAVVGFLNAYQLSGNPAYLDAALNVWEFIENHIVDKTNGEWFWKVDAKGIVDNTSFKVSEWKCPYHNGRACMEIITRIENILSKGQNSAKSAA